MIDQACTEVPLECCGILAGRINDDGTIAEVVERYPLVNDLKSPTEFMSEPLSTFAAQRDMRKRDLAVVAVYHSHPTSEPTPSKRDLERSYSPSVINLIIGLKAPSPEVLAWWLMEDSYEEAMITLMSQ